MNERMKAAIFVLTGFDCVEDLSSEKFELRLGMVDLKNQTDPVIIKYSKKQLKHIGVEELRSWALVSILRAVCDMIEWKKLEQWREKQSP